MSTKIVSWNISARRAPWQELSEMGADVALLQEAREPPADVREKVELGGKKHWDSHSWNSDWYKENDRFPNLYDRWAMVVKLSDRVDVEWFNQVSPICDAAAGEFPVSGIGTVAAARVTPRDAPPFIVVFMYARWTRPHPSIKSKWGTGYPDGQAHRIISDLSTFIGDTDPSTHRILAAGDLNMDYDTLGNERYSLAVRERTVWQRMEAIGLEYMGPQYPAGRRADPIPKHLPRDTKNVPTYRGNKTPASAGLQLDHAFASRGFHKSVTVRALNGVAEWGSSDHCRLLIDVASG